MTILSGKWEEKLGILTGRDAEIFLKNMKEAETRKISPEERKRLEENYKKMKSIIAKSKLNG